MYAAATPLTETSASTATETVLPAQNRAHALRAHEKAAAAADALASGLGWFSIGLGLLELLMPRRMAAATGVPSGALVPLCGLREIGTGIGLLAAERKAPWLWARLVGDALDGATLAASWRLNEHERLRTGAAMAAVAGVALMDMEALHCQQQQARQRRGARFDYSDRVGLPLSPEAMRGAACHPVAVPDNPPA